jgi:exopolysaccharide production protein ExoZ
MTAPAAVLPVARPPAAGTVITIQYLRAVAASLVVLYHALAPLASAPIGLFGVDLFFVISGFVMWVTTAGGERSPLSFWMARIVRIVPLYWLFTTLYILVGLVVPGVLSHAAFGPLFVVKSYLFIPATNPSLGVVAPVYTLGWTLNYEMFFYFLFGLGLFIPWSATRFIALVATFLALVTIGRWAAGGPIAMTYTDPILLEFLAGIALAMLSPWLMRQMAALGWLLILAGVAGLVLVTAAGLPWPRALASGAPAAAIVAGALVLEPLARTVPSRLGLLLGDASYSIYLAHPFGQRVWLLVCQYAQLDLAAPAVAVFYVIAALVVGIASGVVAHLLVERPLLAAGRPLRGRASLARGAA